VYRVQDPVKKCVCSLLVLCGNVDRNWSLKGDICFVNGSKKHVEDISVDAVSGCKFCRFFLI
jgi:hypothetical protein